MALKFNQSHKDIKTSFEVYHDKILASRFTMKLRIIEVDYDGTFGQLHKLVTNISKMDGELFIEMHELQHKHKEETEC